MKKVLIFLKKHCLKLNNINSSSHVKMHIFLFLFFGFKIFSYLMRFLILFFCFENNVLDNLSIYGRSLNYLDEMK
jgi:hypothetical protein